MIKAHKKSRCSILNVFSVVMSSKLELWHNKDVLILLATTLYRVQELAAYFDFLLDKSTQVY